MHGRVRSPRSWRTSCEVAGGREVLPRGDTTLIAWLSDDSGAELGRLTAAGVVAREIPGRGVMRASVGAWNDEADLERLLGAI
jgi:hypothetical protein